MSQRLKSLAGEYVDEYDAKNPALLTKMTGPPHSVETTYEPHHNLITCVINGAKSSTGILPVHRDGPSVPQPAGPSLSDDPTTSTNPAPAARRRGGALKHSETGTMQ